VRKITILVVDDQAVVRQPLRALLSTEMDLAVVGEAENGREAGQKTAELGPDVVLMDLAMPGMNGFHASREILQSPHPPRIIILSSYAEDQDVRETIRAGVAGYVTKTSAAEELVQAIRDVTAGAAFFSSSIARRLRDQSRRALSTANAACSLELTTREAEVLALIARSHSNREVGAALGTSTKTVEKHRQQIMNKRNIHDVAGLRAYAAKKGLVNAYARAGRRGWHKGHGQPFKPTMIHTSSPRNRRPADVLIA
jgi:DNA-binding NarL/FixJ family response regulator